MQRIDKLFHEIERQHLAGVAVNAGPTLTYLTGLHFHLMERPVVMVCVPGQEPTIVLPRLEEQKLSHLTFSARVFTYGENPELWPDVFSQALGASGLTGGRIGVEPRQLRLLEYSYLRGAHPAEYVDGSAIFSALRARKDPEEIERMRRAVQIAEAALTSTLPSVRSGVTEREVASELFVQLMRHGSDGALPFSPIVAAGPNGANPHAVPSTRPLSPGDLLIIDWGASFEGYAADLTRTFAIGELDAEAHRIYRLVEAANGAGRSAGGPGVACAEVDRATRRVIDEGGYGQFFHHRTGHGIGMECHEEPYIHGANEQPLAEGNAYTVEPGIYLAGRNGVRIEDDVVVTASGAESLSTMSRDLLVLA